MLTKFTPTTLPTSQNSIHPVRVVNGQTATIAKTFPMAQLTSIVIATPGTRLAGPQTVQLSKPSLEKQVWAEYVCTCYVGSLDLEAVAARCFLNIPCQGFFISAPNQHPIALLYDNSLTAKEKVELFSQGSWLQNLCVSELPLLALMQKFTARVPASVRKHLLHVPHPKQKIHVSFTQ